jgi:hypothetical protein
MIIGDQHVSCVAFDTLEDNVVVIIDSNAVVSVPVSLSCLQAIAGRDSQIVDVMGGIQQIKLSCRDLPGGPRNRPRPFGVGPIVDVLG